MNNLRAEIEIAETGERVFIEGSSVREMIEKIKEVAGEYVHVTIRILAVMAFVLSFVSYPSYADDIKTAGQTNAPLCVGAHCIGGSND